jgi:hypothetical protein
MSDMVKSDIVDKTASLFKEAVLSLNAPGVVALMREDVQLFSPVPRAPFEGRDVVSAVFEFLGTVTADHRFVSMMQGNCEAILCFAGTLAGKECEWIHWVQIDENGEIWRITDMVRPLSAVLALQAAADGRT